MVALYLLFFFVIERSVLMVLVFHYKGMLEMVTMQRTRRTEQRTQFNTAHALLEKLRLLLRKLRFLTIKCLEFQESLQKSSLEFT